MQPKPKVLLADDEPHITHVVAHKFEGDGFEVFIASDGEEAFELALAHLPDVVVTDLQMPYVSGYELCIRLKATPETSHIPAIMLTARGFLLTDEERQQTNIRRLKSKPFSAREIVSEARKVLEEVAHEATTDGRQAA